MSAEFGSDPWLDARLRDVPLPPGMLARLEQIAATSDDQLDAMVRDVPAAAGLARRGCRGFLGVRRRRLPWRELSLAAAVLIAVGVGLLNVPVRAVRAIDGRRFEVRAVAAAGGASRPAATGVGQQPRWPTDPAAIGGRVPVKLPFDDPRLTAEWHLRRRPADRSRRKPATVDRSPSPDGEGRQPAWRKRLLPPSAREHDGILTAPRGSDRLPPLETVNRTLNRGLAPPLVPGYDLLYQLKTGERPFVSPESDPALASSPVPLIRDTSSYLLARDVDRRRAFAAGR